MDPLTRAIAETILVNRLGPMMAVAEMNVTALGFNPDCHDPLAWATRMVGGDMTYLSTVDDDDLALLPTTVYDDLMTLAEYRLLKNIQGALNAVDITTGPRSEKLHQFVQQVQQMIDNLEPVVEAMGVLTQPMTAGYISLDFREHHEDRL